MHLRTEHHQKAVKQMAKKREEEPKKGAPEWQSTFADLMNLLLCFFVLLFSMSTVDAQKFELIAASFSQTFSIFTAGSTMIGDGAMIGNGISQLPELDDYINSVGRMAENTPEMEQLDDLQSEVQEEGLRQSEEMAEKIEEAVTFFPSYGSPGSPTFTRRNVFPL